MIAAPMIDTRWSPSSTRGCPNHRRTGAVFRTWRVFAARGCGTPRTLSEHRVQRSGRHCGSAQMQRVPIQMH